ncbi:proton-translocating NADH-quinone oxidoreductase, chain N [Desulfobulbus propionicus DSM 2032]|uniref:NADH-quinone oxidoreductase subunit N n=1 Tax=Desulfobulbus propionicus (strain ATCC 33891 / DSM 2032 / VKM B-1956 / 1pr3) TaxID=577650 RepID=A0A7U3YMC7_DESPD|nr:NADH-quinone oxidoreductase subunit N [Desulfobulbus propionicus]ADW18019.1 proton-translocating NADH-quinone oxidoreductase, chain N [Desulfobulbus propionicus DSM 2032]
MIATVAVNWAAVEPILPELLLITIGVLLIGCDLFLPRQRQLLPWLTVIGCLTALAMILGSRPTVAFGGMFLADGYAMVFKTICLGSVILSVLMSEHFCRVIGLRQGEYYSLMLFSLVGMLLMASAGDLMVLYLGLELMALPIYALVGLHKREQRTSEAAIKYFLMGSFGSALLLFGMSMVYGLTGTTEIARIAELIGSRQLVANPALLAGLGLLLAGFCFKVAVAPFHLWTPDVYEGAPTIVTAFMSVGPKAAGFAIFGRVLFVGLPELHGHWGPVLAVLALLTMAVGNITALCQQSLKRMLAYSAIAHAGYALLGLLAGTAEGMAATMTYLMVYLFMNIGAFAILMLLATPDAPCESIDDCKGLASRNPVAAALMLVFLFSLTGIPPTGGFIGKFYLLKAAFIAGYPLTVVGAVLFSAISAFFYLRVVRFMYMEAPQQTATLQFSPGMRAALGLCLLGVLGLGLFPGSLLNWTVSAFSGM